jgi:hypothetical protein
MDLHTAQKEGEQLKQQNIELSSRAWSLRDRAERSSQVLDEALTVLQKCKAVRPIAIGEEVDRTSRPCQVDLFDCASFVK